jgi:exosortase A
MSNNNRANTKLWLRHGFALAILLLLILVVFRAAVVAAVDVWWVSPTYSHCFLIIPIVIWLIWEKRAALGKVAPSVAPYVLLFIPLLILVWWLGELSAINEVRQFAVVAFIQVVIVALLGIDIVRIIWFPILYLIFLVPTGEYLIAPMQRFATHFVDVSLNIAGIPHYTEGTTFELTNGRFEIAEACAGLRFLIATVTLGVLFSYLMFRKLYKTLLFLVACVTVPLIGNGLRCVGIIMLAHFTNNRLGAGADHIVYGWGFNVAILLVLGFIGSRFRDEFGEQSIARTSHVNSTATLTMIAVLAGGLVCAGPAFAWWHDNYFVPPDVAAIEKPLHLAGWREVMAPSSWHPEFAGADAQLLASFARSGSYASTPVDLYVGYYARPRPGHSMTAHVDRFWNDQMWTQSAINTTAGMLAGHPIRLQEWDITSPAERRLIISAYWVDGRFTDSLFTLKVSQAVAALRGHEGQAVVALSTVVDGSTEDARARLLQFVLALDQLPKRFRQAGHQAQIRGASATEGNE